MEDDLKQHRKNYQRSILLESSASANPFDQFSLWLSDAQNDGYIDYNSFTLATNGADGFPHTRIVLLRGHSPSGLIFFTNYTSAKGREIERSPKVSANFFWNTMERQVRIRGIVSRISEQDSDEYFGSRPRESRIAAWASIQSTELRTREELDGNMEFYSHKFDGVEVPRPPHWGGYRIIPHYFEFWQGRPSRLHDRLVYRLDADSNWFIVRLAP